MTGDIDDELAERAHGSRGIRRIVDTTHRVVALAALGHRRLAAGRAR